MVETPRKRLFLLILDDANTRALSQMVVAGVPRDCVVVLCDRTLGSGRIWRLWRGGSITLPWLVRQCLAARRQRRELAGKRQISCDHCIVSNADLLVTAQQYPEIDTLIAFRAGILLNNSVLRHLRCYNTHYARLPDYPGLGSVARALAARDHAQEATLHTMSARVDTGETLMTEPYRLDPALPYWRNELNAATAGTRVAGAFLRRLLEDTEPTKTAQRR